MSVPLQNSGPILIVVFFVVQRIKHENGRMNFWQQMGVNDGGGRHVFELFLAAVVFIDEHVLIPRPWQGREQCPDKVVDAFHDRLHFLDCVLKKPWVNPNATLQQETITSNTFLLRKEKPAYVSGSKAIAKIQEQ